MKIKLNQSGETQLIRRFFISTWLAWRNAFCLKCHMQLRNKYDPKINEDILNLKEVEQKYLQKIEIALVKALTRIKE
jgi:hypothetical protein